MNTNIRKLAIAGLLVAIDILAARFFYVYLPPGTTIVRISPQFLAHALAGWLLGPLWAILSAVAGDILGMFINSAGKTIYPGYTASAALHGLIFGLILHRRRVVIWRSSLAVTISVLAISLCLTSYWSSLYFSRPWLELFNVALPWRVMTIPIYASGLYIIQKALERTGAAGK